MLQYPAFGETACSTVCGQECMQYILAVHTSAGLFVSRLCPSSADLGVAVCLTVCVQLSLTSPLFGCWSVRVFDFPSARMCVCSSEFEAVGDVTVQQLHDHLHSSAWSACLSTFVWAVPSLCVLVAFCCPNVVAYSRLASQLASPATWAVSEDASTPPKTSQIYVAN